MSPNDKIDELCRRHDVSASFGRRLLPLVRRALSSPEEKRERLLDLIERSFAEEARRKRAAHQRGLSEKERELLRTVAGILHPWEPPKWMTRWKWGPPGPAPQ